MTYSLNALATNDYTSTVSTMAKQMKLVAHNAYANAVDTIEKHPNFLTTTMVATTVFAVTVLYFTAVSDPLISVSNEPISDTWSQMILPTKSDPIPFQPLIEKVESSASMIIQYAMDHPINTLRATNLGLAIGFALSSLFSPAYSLKN